MDCSILGSFFASSVSRLCSPSRSGHGASSFQRGSSGRRASSWPDTSGGACKRSSGPSLRAYCAQASGREGGRGVREGGKGEGRGGRTRYMGNKRPGSMGNSSAEPRAPLPQQSARRYSFSSILTSSESWPESVGGSFVLRSCTSPSARRWGRGDWRPRAASGPHFLSRCGPFTSNSSSSDGSASWPWGWPCGFCHSRVGCPRTGDSGRPGGYSTGESCSSCWETGRSLRTECWWDGSVKGSLADCSCGASAEV